MSSPRIDETLAEAIRSITPEEMTRFLAIHGWTDSGPYARSARLFKCAYDDQRIAEVIVPMNANAFDFGEWMYLAIESISKAYGAKMRTVVTAITSMRHKGYHAFIHYQGRPILIELMDQVVTSDGSIIPFSATEDLEANDDPVEMAAALLADSIQVIAMDNERIIPQGETVRPRHQNCLQLIVRPGDATVQ